ncbi:hypothetical protein BRIN106911_24495 [Brevibacillus invocatus]
MVVIPRHFHFTKRSGVFLYFKEYSKIGFRLAVPRKNAHFRSAKVELVNATQI